MDLYTLIINALKVGYLAYGGGGTMIVLVHRLFVQPGYLSEDLFSRMVGTTFLVPGPFGINIGALAGLEVAGFLGVIIMVLGIIAPSFTLMPLMWKLMGHMPDNRWTIGFKKSTKVIGWALSFFAAILILKGLIVHTGHTLAIGISVYSLLWIGIMYKYKLHPGWFIGFTMVLGVVLGMVGII
ncbi:hypothetical protein GM182_00525 [bacterium 3DAC]|jgi:chromate transporter|nr:chromate transporter [Dictyoglomota bacterium]UZN22435.1 hypothetical protein GM182_00525 [bacterium 3DAC]